VNNYDKTIRSLLLAAPPIYRKVFRPDCSLEGTCIAIEALAYFGVPATAMSASLWAFNPYAVKVVETEGLLTSENPKAEEHLEAGYHAAWVGKTGDVVPGRWDGYLVIVTDKHLVDLTIGNAGVPEKGLPLAAMSLERPESFDQPAGYELPGGAKVLYTFYPTDTSYKQARNWSKERLQDVTGLVIRAMKAVQVQMEAEDGAAV